VFAEVLTQDTERASLFAEGELEFPINFLRADLVAFSKHLQMGFCWFGEIRQYSFYDYCHPTNVWDIGSYNFGCC
jgi:hypothetical protein